MASPPKTAPLKLYRGGPPKPRYNFSSFVNKLEAIFRFSKVAYTQEVGSIQESPRGKIPYVQFSGSRELVGDSHLIVQQLIKNGAMKDPSADLSILQKTQEVAMRALVEERLYFINTHECWLIPSNYYAMRDIGPLAPLAYPLRYLIGIIVYTKLSFTLSGQGTSRYTADERAAMMTEGLDAISDLLALSRPADGERVYWALGSKEPSEFDGTLFGFVAAVLVSPGSGCVKKLLRGYPVLLDWAGRIHEEYYAGWEKWEE